MGFREALRILKAFVCTVLFSKVRSLVTEQFSSTAPIKMGPYAVKFTIRPAESTEATARRPLTRNFLRDELADRLRKGGCDVGFPRTILRG